ncbi:MAG: queuosine precursor transporter [Acidobacteriota bacterium]
MLPQAFSDFFAAHQSLLWVLTVALDLAFTLLMYRLFGKQGLYAVICLNVLLCNLQGPKLTTVFGMTTSLGVILYSGIYFATDLLSERYGRREANRAVRIGFAVSILVIVFMALSLMFLPTREAGKAHQLAVDAHQALAFLFGFTPRFILGSLVAYLVSQSHDVWFFHLLKEKTGGRHLWLRNTLSTVVSQAIDTLIYSLVVWWAVLDLPTALRLAAVKYVFKVIIAILDTPFIYWARSWGTSVPDWQEAGPPVRAG